MPHRSVCAMSCCLRPNLEGSAFGLNLSRPLLGSLTLRPGDSLTIPRMALSVGFIRFVSSTNATQAKGLLTSTPVGLSPTEHASLSLDALGRQILFALLKQPLPGVAMMETSQTKMQSELLSRILDRWRPPLRRVFV